MRQGIKVSLRLTDVRPGTRRAGQNNPKDMESEEEHLRNEKVLNGASIEERQLLLMV